MLAVESTVFLEEGVTRREITEFMPAPSDARYRAWWPGTRLQFHVAAGAVAR